MNKTAVITGSTKGIGRAIALRLAREQYNVVLNYAHDDKAATETLGLCLQENQNTMLIQADIAKKSEVTRLMQSGVDRFGTLDVLINNAAHVVDRPLLEMSEEDWDEVVDINLKGTFLCSQIAAAYMLQQDNGGLILNIGASTGIRARKNGVNTCTSKAGIMLMTQCLALELGPKVRANTIIPGLTRTDETVRRFHLDDPEILHARTETVPAQRIGVPEDIANAVILLLSPEAQFINGQKIVVDGGQYMW